MLIPRMASRRAAGSAGGSIEQDREQEPTALGTTTAAPTANGAISTSGPDAGDPRPAPALIAQAGGAEPGTLGPSGAPLWREVRIPHAAKLMLGLCAVAFAALVYLTRNLDFYYDEWSFLESAHSWTLRSYFVPHNEHWSTVPMLIYKTLLILNGAHSYVPFMAVLLLIHVGAAFLLFAVVRRRCGDLPALIAGTIMLFLGRGSENIVWAFQIGFLGSVFFGLLALHLLGRRPAVGRGRAAAGSAALLLALMSSGMGLFFLVAAGLDLLLDRDRRRLLWTLAVPSVAYVWWYLTFGREGTAHDHSIFTFKTLEGLVGYTPTGIGSATAGVFALAPIWAPIALAALTATAALLWYRKRLDTGLAIPAAVAIVLQFTLTGLVRAQYGDSQATAPRYVYIGAVFVLLILTEALRGARWRGPWRVVAPITAAAVVLGGAAVLVHREHLQAKSLAVQKHELEITWLFRGSPDLQQNVVLDPQLLPVVTPALYYAVRDRYGSPLPTLSTAQLTAVPQSVANKEMRLLMPLLLSQFALRSAATAHVPAGCQAMVPSGGYADVTVPGGSDASVQPIGPHAASIVVLSYWYLGDAPDGGSQHANVSAGHGLRVGFPDTGRHLSWHFRLQVAGGSPVALCLGGAGSTPAA